MQRLFFGASLNYLDIHTNKKTTIEGIEGHTRNGKMNKLAI